jgi:hypothetical protein
MAYEKSQSPDVCMCVPCANQLRLWRHLPLLCYRGVMAKSPFDCRSEVTQHRLHIIGGKKKWLALPNQTPIDLLVLDWMLAK